MDNRKYWEERMELSQKLSEKQVTKKVIKLYKQAYKNINYELMRLWEEMMLKGDVCMVNMLQSKHYTTLQNLIQSELTSIGLKQIGYTQQNLLDVFKLGCESFDEPTVPIVIDDEVARQIVRQSYKGATFSDRIWKDMDTLKEQIQDKIVETAIQGKDVRKASKELQNRLNVGVNEARRIVVTETARVHNEGCRQGAISRGYTHYRFLAEKDSKTCEECLALDGKVFPLTDTSHMPPLHPHSRSAITIVVE